MKNIQLSNYRIPQLGDYIKTISSRFKTQWKGKIIKEFGENYLIKWGYCGGLPTDICTWVFLEDIKVTKRLKNLNNVTKNVT